MAFTKDVQDAHRDGLISVLSLLYDREHLCDLTLTCTFEGQTHTQECHKLVLCAASEYFRQRLTSDADDNDEHNLDVNIINLNDTIHPSVLKETLTFMYRGHCEVTSDNYEQLLDISTEWKLDGLKTGCCNWMADNVAVDSAVRFYHLTLTCDSDTAVVESLIKYILVNFEDISLRESFSSLSLEQFKRILSYHYRKFSEETAECDTAVEPRTSHIAEETVGDEGTCSPQAEFHGVSSKELYEAVNLWYKANPEEDIDDLLSLIRYDCMSHEYLVQILPDLAKAGRSEVISKVQGALITVNMRSTELSAGEKKEKHAQSESSERGSEDAEQAPGAVGGAEDTSGSNKGSSQSAAEEKSTREPRDQQQYEDDVRGAHHEPALWMDDRRGRHRWKRHLWRALGTYGSEYLQQAMTAPPEGQQEAGNRDQQQPSRGWSARGGRPAGMWAALGQVLQDAVIAADEEAQEGATRDGQHHPPPPHYRHPHDRGRRGWHGGESRGRGRCHGRWRHHHRDWT